MSVLPSSGLPPPIAEVNPSGMGDAVYRACFELSPAAQVILGPKGELRDLKAQACLVMGHERNALLGQRITDVV
ncbi:MAG TPA: hypothetical protein VFH49_03505, partial [Aquabacterium sp.]|nr:hypothetical protein [Aquabacterium sp.]